MMYLDSNVIFAGGFAGEEVPSATMGSIQETAAEAIGLLFAPVGADFAPVLQRGSADRPRLRFFSADEMAELSLADDPVVPLTIWRGRPVVGRTVDIDGDDGKHRLSLSDIRGLRAIGPLLPPREAALSARGAALVGWHRRARFCPICGAPTVPGPTGFSRRCISQSCKTEHFPRLDPVVMTLPTDGDRCLLGRQPRFPEGLWSGFAGHVEAGETLEQAAKREVFEEAGVELADVRYRLSQPWPFPHCLTLGCFGRVDGAPVARADGTEIDAICWFERDEIASMLAHAELTGETRMPGPISLAHQLARLWLTESTMTNEGAFSCS